MDNLFCDLEEVVINRNIDLNETDLSILLCGLTIYKDSLERLKSKTEFVCKEIRRVKDLKGKLQLLALEIEKEYDEKE